MGYSTVEDIIDQIRYYIDVIPPKLLELNRADINKILLVRDRLDLIERLMMDVATVDAKTGENVDRWDEPVIFTLGGEFKKLIYDEKILQSEYSVDDIIIWCDKIINFLKEKGY